MMKMMITIKAMIMMNSVKTLLSLQELKCANIYFRAGNICITGFSFKKNFYKKRSFKNPKTLIKL